MATNIIERQYPLSAAKSMGIANIGAGAGITVNLPPKALLKAVGSLTTTAFTDNTTATLTATDGTTVFMSAVDVKAAGADAGTGVPKYFPNGGTITFTLAETGTAATAGALIAYADYVVLDRQSEVQM